MSRERSTLDKAARAADFATRLDNLLHLTDRNGSTALSRLADAAANLGAVATDSEGGGGAVAWCEDHEREVHQCHDRCRAHDVPLDRCRGDGRGCYLAHVCVGVPVRANDPTGEAVVRHNQARDDLRALERLVSHAEKTLRAALTLAEPWSPRPPSEAERQSLHVENTPGCESCSRLEVAKGVRRWEPTHPKVPGATSVGGRLAREMRLCRWCYEHVGTRGCLPNLVELRDHHAGKRVDCHHPVVDDWSAKKPKGKAKAASKSAPDRRPTRAQRLADRTRRRAQESST